MRVGFDASGSSMKASNSFKIGTWTPVWVQLRGGCRAVQRVHGRGGRRRRWNADGVPDAGRRGGQQERAVHGVRPPGSRDPEFSIRLLDQNGRRVGWSVARGGDAATARGAHAERKADPDPGAAAGSRDDGGPARLQGRGQTVPAAGVEEIVTARIDPQNGSIPGRWYGYDAARAIVLDTDDREAMSALDALRGQPLVDWVERGGHLVVSVGANWQAVRDSVLAPILPGLPNGQEQVASLEALDTFAGSNKPITPPGTPPVMVTKLEEVKERGGTVLSVTSNLPLVVRGAYGFGRVTLIAIDVDQKPFSDWPDRSLFWVRAIDLKRPRG